MPSDYAGDDTTYPATIPCPIDSDPPNASATTNPLQKLADRTAYIMRGIWAAFQEFDNGIKVLGGSTPAAAVDATGGGLRAGVKGTGGVGGADGVQGVGTSNGVDQAGVGVKATGNEFRGPLLLAPQGQPTPGLEAEGEVLVTNATTKLFRVFLNTAWHTIGVLDRVQTWAEQVFVAGTTNAHGIISTGNGSGAGVHGVGGTTAGAAGVEGVGQGGTGHGVVGTAAGAGSGVIGGGGTGPGVQGSSVSGPGALFSANGTRGAVNVNPSTAPGTPVEGDIYYDATTHHFFGYTNTGWKQLDN